MENIESKAPAGMFSPRVAEIVAGLKLGPDAVWTYNRAVKAEREPARDRKFAEFKARMAAGKFDQDPNIPAPSLPEIESAIYSLKFLGELPATSRWRRCYENWLGGESSDPPRDEGAAAAIVEAIRLMHAADCGDSEARRIVDGVKICWEDELQYAYDEAMQHAADMLKPGMECPCCDQVYRPSTGKKKPDEAKGAEYAPSVKPGSSTALVWQALVDQSPAGEPVLADAWRDAALVLLARSDRKSDPVAAYRDAKRNLKAQKAFTEVSDGTVIRRTKP